MLRSSRRSASTPKLRGPNSHGKRAPTPNRKAGDVGDRPAWDDTASDLNKYKLAPDALARRKEQRVSKHMISLNNNRRSSCVSDWAPQHSMQQFSPRTTADDDTLSRDRFTNAAEDDVPIDYSKVLQMLGQASISSTPASQAPQPARNMEFQSHMSERAGDDMGDAGYANHGEDDAHALPSDSLLLDATFAGMGQLDMSSAMQVPQSAAHLNGPSVHPSVARHAWADVSITPAKPRTAAAPQGHASGAATGMHALGSSAASMDAAMASAEQRQRMLEDRLAALEASRQQEQSRQQQHSDVQREVASVAATAATAAATAHTAYEEVSSLKQMVRELQGDNAKLRTELTEFTSHASSLISKLQTQLHQLLSFHPQAQAQQQRPVTAQHIADSLFLPSLQRVAAELSADPQLQPPHGAGLGAAAAAQHQQYPQPMSQQPSRALFSDLPTGPNPLAAAAASTRTALQAGAISSVPASNYDDEVALPSYAALRRSAAGMPSGIAAATAAMSGGSASASAGAAAAAAAGGAFQQQRALPAPFQQRSLGQASLLAHGSNSNAGGGLPPGAAAAALVAAERSAAATNLAYGAGGISGIGGVAGDSGLLGGAGLASMLPQPLVFPVASDFKIVRVGTGPGAAGGLGGNQHHGLSADNSMSLSAHAAAAARSRARGAQ